MSLTVDTIRTEFKKNDDIRDAGLATPDDIVRFDDIPYGALPQWQSLDVYRPTSGIGRELPVIVSVHGGGWVYGDKERYQFYCMSLAQRGFAVVNFTYRLAPEFKFPAQLEDTNAVFQWVLDNAAEYGFDTAHIFAVGDSAGAHLLSLYSCFCVDPEYAATYDFRPPEGFCPTAIALNCGVYAIAMDGSRDGLMAALLPGGGTEAECAHISPMNHIGAGFPPTFVMTATGDFLKPNAAPLAERLLSLDIPFVYRLYGTAENRLGHVFHCDMRLDDARLCNDEECGFFRSFL